MEKDLKEVVPDLDKIRFYDDTKIVEYLMKYIREDDIPNNILLYHLSRRLKDSSDDAYNLVDLLTKENTVRDFLFAEGLTFQKDSSKIKVYYNNEEVIFDTQGTNCLLLENRFSIDTCINGFIINGKFDNYDHLEDGPEFMVKLIEYMKEKNIFQDESILEKYKSQSEYYCYIYKVPIKIIEIDGINKEYLEKVPLKYKILQLIISDSSTIIRLPDEFNLSKDYLIHKYKIKDIQL